VRFTGEVPDIRPLVASSAVFVCPIREGGGTRLKILNALAQGIPLVATTMAVEGIGVRHGVHALLADDEAGFASAAQRLFEDPSLARELARAGRLLVESRFSWNEIGRDLRDACDGIVSRSKVAATEASR
jgi:glycosyltransferase involved in cell wall biosynthesis